MPYEIVSGAGSFLSIASKTPTQGMQVSLYPPNTTPALRKKWIFQTVSGGTQIILNADNSYVLATKNTPEYGTTLQLIPQQSTPPHESLFILYSIGSPTSYIVSADPGATTAFFIDNSGNQVSGPAHMWSYNAPNQMWSIVDVDGTEES